MRKFYKRTEHIYENGLKHVHYDVPFLETVGAAINVNAGSVNEDKPELEGAAHFLEHMLFNGSKRYPDREARNALYQGLGVRDNAFTSFGVTRYYFLCVKEALAEALPALADMIASPLLRPEDVEKEKRIILEEVEMGENDPRLVSIWGSVIDSMPETGYAHKIIGTKESVSGMTVERLKQFHEDYYNVGNLYLLTYGGIEYEEIAPAVKEVSTFFDKHDPVEPYHLEAKSLPLTKKDQIREIKTETQATKTTTISIIEPVGQLEEIVAYKILDHMLGVGEGALLREKLVREKALVSDLSYEVEIYPGHTMVFFLFSGAGSKIDEVMEEYKTLFNKVLEEDFSEEMGRARGVLLGNLLQKFEAPFDFLYDYSFDPELFSYMKGLKPFDFVQYTDMVEKIDFDTCQKIWKEKLSDLKFTTVSAVPKK